MRSARSPGYGWPYDGPVGGFGGNVSENRLLSRAGRGDRQGEFSIYFPDSWTSSNAGGTLSCSDGFGAWVSVIKLEAAGVDCSAIAEACENMLAQTRNACVLDHGTATLGGNRGIYLLYTAPKPDGRSALQKIVAAPFGVDAWMLVMSAPAGSAQQLTGTFQRIEASFKVSRPR
jgi:hypothetical protein